jgi:hydrogenase maturation factor
MTVVEVDERSGLALCADCQGGRRTVETALVGALSGGDCVLVHADVAIASLPAGKSAVRERAGGMSELAV